MTDRTHPYDPDEPEPSQRSAYLTRKDLKRLGIGLVILIPILIAAYRALLGQSELHRCALNFNAIHAAIGIYEVDWNDRFPPAAVSKPDGVPFVFDGKPVTWGTQLRRYMPPRASLSCPSADPSEVMQAQDPVSSAKSVPMSYGIYAAMAAYPSALVTNPSGTIVISETSNFGAKKTYNPFPFEDGGQRLPFDAYLIGYDNSNTVPSATTRAVTRLAFYETANGVFTPDTRARHGDRIHALFADGHLGFIRAPDAIVRFRGETPVGLWADH